MPAKNRYIPPADSIEAINPPVEPALPDPVPEPPLAPMSPSPNNPPQTMNPGDERTWGMLAHLSTLLNLVTGFGGPIAALIIYIVYKDRSRFVAYHALQAMVFQLIWWFGGGVVIGLMWAIVGMLSAIVIGIVLIPVAAIITPILALLPIGALIYGIVGAVKVNQGQDFKYWLVGDWMRGTLTG
jgi:uncharacterized Tic20 family protein